MKKLTIWGAIIFLVSGLGACTTPSVRSTVDSYGEGKAMDSSSAGGESYFFELSSLGLLEKQAAVDCRLAAEDSGLKVVENNCQNCKLVTVRARIVGTEEVVSSTPGFASAWGGYGRRSRFGTGVLANSDIESHPEAGREMVITIFSDSTPKTPSREIDIRSIGTENSVNAVAYEMCKAGFQDFPLNLKGKFYDLKRANKASGT